MTSLNPRNSCTWMLTTALTLAMSAGLIVGAAPAALAKGASYEVLYSFAGQPNDGADPRANLIEDSAGNLYGTTFYGGTANDGTVFELAQNGAETVLYSFASLADGTNPGGGRLLRDSAGNLYGTTFNGGTAAGEGGTVFKLAPDGTKTTLYSFCPSDCADGYEPETGLIADRKGDLYGTTVFGGTSGWGTVFEVEPDGTETVLHSFTGTDGADPQSDLIRIGGNLYGTTYQGGTDDNGTVFELVKGKKGAWTINVLHSFTGGTDGGNPAGDLTADSAGNVYGTAEIGGTHGSGNVFKLAPDGTETVLYSFTGGSDGGFPTSSLLMKKGNLYGTTGGGGTSGLGTVFELASDGTETVLHSFAGGSDGEFPGSASPLVESKGYLYGTTASGGAGGSGTAFKVKE